MVTGSFTYGYGEVVVLVVSGYVFKHCNHVTSVTECGHAIISTESRDMHHRVASLRDFYESLCMSSERVFFDEYARVMDKALEYDAAEHVAATLLLPQLVGNSQRRLQYVSR